MKYIKSFKIFESNEEIEFVVTDETTVDQFEDYLNEKIEARYSYGSESTLEDIINTIVYNSLLSAGKSEQEAESVADDFVKMNMDNSYESIPDEFDMYERRTEGVNKYKSRVIFEFSCGGDGYGFCGSFNDLTELLNDIKELLK